METTKQKKNPIEKYQCFSLNLLKMRCPTERECKEMFMMMIWLTSFSGSPRNKIEGKNFSEIFSFLRRRHISSASLEDRTIFVLCLLISIFVPIYFSGMAH